MLVLVTNNREIAVVARNVTYHIFILKELLLKHTVKLIIFNMANLLSQ